LAPTFSFDADQKIGTPDFGIKENDDEGLLPVIVLPGFFHRMPGGNGAEETLWRW
jgi:hypothetical protein